MLSFCILRPSYQLLCCPPVCVVQDIQLHYFSRDDSTTHSFVPYYLHSSIQEAKSQPIPPKTLYRSGEYVEDTVRVHIFTKQRPFVFAKPSTRVRYFSYGRHLAQVSLPDMSSTMSSPLPLNRRRLSLATNNCLEQDLSRAVMASPRPKFALSTDTNSSVTQPPPPPPSPVGFPASFENWSLHQPEGSRTVCT